MAVEEEQELNKQKHDHTSTRADLSSHKNSITSSEEDEKDENIDQGNTEKMKLAVTSLTSSASVRFKKIGLEKKNMPPSKRTLEENIDQGNTEKMKFAVTRDSTLSALARFEKTGLEKRKIPSSKLPLEEHIDQGNTKKTKLAEIGDSTFAVSPRFEKKYTQDDEILILEGLLDHKLKHNSLSVKVMEFSESIKDSISFKPSASQVYEKIRRLRENYMKKKGNATEVEKSTPHDCQIFELSKKAWWDFDATRKNNNQNENRSTTKNKNAVAASDEGVAEVEDTLKVGCENDMNMGKPMGGVGGAPDSIDLRLLDDEKRAEFENRRKALIIEEYELRLKKLELEADKVRCILKALKEGGDHNGEDNIPNED